MSFEYQPTLKGRLVELRPLRTNDFDALYLVAADPLLWEQHPVKNRHEAEEFQEFFREAWRPVAPWLSSTPSLGK